MATRTDDNYILNYRFGAVFVILAVVIFVPGMIGCRAEKAPIGDTLLTQSQRIMELEAWKSYDIYNHWYAWGSEGELLWLKTMNTSDDVLLMSTNVRQHHDRMIRRMGSTEGAISVPSPNGKYLLRHDEATQKYIVTDLQGSRVREYSGMEGFDSVGWAGDSHAWIGIKRDRNRLNISRYLIHTQQPIPLSFLLQNVEQEGYPEFLGEKGGLITVCVWGSNAQGSIKILSLDMSHPDLPPVAAAITRPAGCQIDAIKKSPMEDILVWQLYFRENSSERGRVAFWLSRLDGTDMHESGRVEEEPGSGSYSSGRALSPEWTPDGKQISFIFCENQKEYIYQLPVRPVSDSDAMAQSADGLPPGSPAHSSATSADTR